MTKFGEIVNTKIPVLIGFYNGASLGSQDKHFSTLKSLASNFGNDLKVIKIDFSKNKSLAKILNLKSNPTYMIYKKGQMKWRRAGNQDLDSLIQVISTIL